MYRAICVAVVLSWSVTSGAQTNTPPSPVTFYQDIVNAISSASGNLVMDLSGGFYRTSIGKRRILIRVESGTESELSFKYEGGALQSARVTFDPPIHFYVSGGGAASGGIRSLTYNHNGTLTSDGVDIWYDSHLTNANALLGFRDFFELSTEARDVFRGAAWPKLTGVRLCSDEDGNTCNAPGRIISRVRALRRGENDPALMVSFKDHFVVRLSKRRLSGVQDNSLTLKSGSQVVFDKIVYIPEGPYVEASLRDASFFLERGTISVGSSVLNLQDNSKLTLQAIEATHTETGTTRITGENGTIEASLRRGSKVEWGADGARSTLLIDDGTQATFNSVNLAINDETGARFSVSADSELRIRVFDGTRIGFGQVGFIQLRSGDLAARLALNLSDRFGSGVSGTLTNLEVNLGSGELELNPVSRLRIATGRVVGSGLSVNSSLLTPIVGQFSTVMLNLADENHFGVPGGFVLSTRPGGRLEAIDPNDPITLSANSRYPTGKLKIMLPFERFENAAVGSVALRQGDASFTLDRDIDGSIHGKDCEVSGDLQVRAPDDSIFTAQIHLSRATLEVSPRGGNPVFQGKLSGTIPAGTGWTFATPYQHDVPVDTDFLDDARIFPIMVNARLAAPVVLPESDFKFEGGKVTASVETAMKVNVEIPGGNGEHDDRDDPGSADHGGPDEYQNFQELFQADGQVPKVGLDVCTLHVYLEPHAYPVDVQAKVSFDNEGLLVDLAAGTKEAARFGKDGCSGGVLGAVVGLMFAGIPGAIAGRFGGDSAEQKILAKVGERAQARLSEVRRQFRVVY